MGEATVAAITEVEATADITDIITTSQASPFTILILTFRRITITFTTVTAAFTEGRYLSSDVIAKEWHVQ
jgi:hypothetical protein